MNRTENSTCTLTFFSIRIICVEIRRLLKSSYNLVNLEVVYQSMFNKISNINSLLVERKSSNDCANIPDKTKQQLRSNKSVAIRRLNIVLLLTIMFLNSFYKLKNELIF